jgi:hypothetical protein
MATREPKLKLGKGAAFVKSRLKQLEQGDDVWEADFRALPKPRGQAETHHLGLVVALPEGNPLVCMPVEYAPTVNDLADLLADAMRRPMTAEAHRPRQIAFRHDPRWEELFPHLKQLGIEVSVLNDLPHVEVVYEDFLRQMRRARSNPLILRSHGPTDVEKSFPAIATWVRGYGHVEIGDQEGFGFIVRAIDYGGVAFEDDKPNTLAEAVSSLEKGLAEYFEREGIDNAP